jgi:hypothetical protein
VTRLTECSNRAWKLAIFPAHPSVHDHGEVPAELAFGYVGTGAAERARIRQCRRLLATCWLLMLLPRSLSHPAHSAKYGRSTTPTLADPGPGRCRWAWAIRILSSEGASAPGLTLVSV